MKSVFDELSGKIRQDPSLIRRSGPRQDLGLLLFNERDNLDALWKAAEAFLSAEEGPGQAGLREAVEALRPLFGQRAG